jgi:hypothetical protein
MGLRVPSYMRRQDRPWPGPLFHDRRAIPSTQHARQLPNLHVRACEWPSHCPMGYNAPAPALTYQRGRAKIRWTSQIVGYFPCKLSI